MLIAPPVGTGGTVSAKYCYSVFMRHRVIAARYGLSKTPNCVVELGPGDSIGIGLMALLTGSENYCGIDAVVHASANTNLAVFEELILLLTNRTPIPFDGDWAEIRPPLSSYDFPHDIFDEASLSAALAPERLQKIRQWLLNKNPDSQISYLAPFGELDGLKPNSVDWIFSQAVMEHVDKLSATYHHCFRCLRPDGIMTHQIDYRCHETASEWNGHWKYPQWLWALMRGRRPWFVNRVAHSAHRQMQQEAGFTICTEIMQTRPSGIARRQLASQFQNMSNDDLDSAGAMFVSTKCTTK